MPMRVGQSRAYGLRTKSLKNEIRGSFAETGVRRGAFAFAAQGALTGAGFERFGGGLPHDGQILGCGPGADPAVIPVIRSAT